MNTTYKYGDPLRKQIHLSIGGNQELDLLIVGNKTMFEHEIAPEMNISRSIAAGLCCAFLLFVVYLFLSLQGFRLEG